jgi:hypothetical protein
MAKDSAARSEPLRPPFRHDAGRRWQADLPPALCEPSDTSEAPFASRLVLFEDGRALGPAHSLHDAIAQDGQGRYSHWGGVLWFSTSDGTDPNANGRRYTVALGPPALKVLGFGSCHLHAALADLQARGLARSLWPDARVSYSPRETLEVIEVELGRRTLPDVLQAFVRRTEPAKTSLARVYRQADVVFLELGSAIDVVYGGSCVTRTQLSRGLLEPLGAVGRLEGRVAKRWYHQGLIKQNEAVRRECATELAELLPRAGLDPAVTGEIVRHARGASQDQDAVANTIGAISELLAGKPICILTTQNLFTPDGRPVTWPGNFPKELDPVCRRLGLPLLHSSQLVAERGMAFSVESDLHHFTPPFLSYLGDRLLALAREHVTAHAARSAA